ncbi:MAG: hypothetical protein AAF990_09555 [Bacteroidota bacterium]
MKHILILLSLFLTTSAVLNAQGNGDVEARINKARKDFFEKELQLSAAESEGFWPIYDQMRDEQEELKKTYQMDRKVELMSDSEVEDYILRGFELEQKEIELKKKYFAEFKKVMSIRKIATLKRTEKRFKRELLKRMAKRRQNARNKRQQRNSDDNF